MARQNRTSYYIDGNVVRKEQYYDLDQKQERISYRRRRSMDKASYMTLPYVLVLTLACLLVVGMAAYYVSVRSQVSVVQREVRALETQLEAVRIENEDLALKVDQGIDLQEIYRVATQEMGMVFPAYDQLLYYEKAESEYVRQNENIPKR